MNPFPVISSILSPKALSTFVIDKYGFGEATTCKVLRQGINHAYLVTDQEEKYVLRVYHLNWKSKGEITAELDLLNFLKSNQISVSFPLKDREGNYIQRIPALEGERFAVLFSYAIGDTVRNPSEKTCFHLGMTMARMHQLTIDKKINRKSYDADTLMVWAYEQAKTKFSVQLPAMQYFTRAVDTIQNQFANADTSQLRFGAVHLDMWYDNMKIKGDTEITLFDFDNCGNGWLFLDISYSVMSLFRHEPDKDSFRKKLLSFYQGYESICSLSEEEKRLIPYGGLAIWLHYSGVHAQRFDDFCNVFLSEDFLQYWIHAVDTWMEYNGIKI